MKVEAEAGMAPEAEVESPFEDMAEETQPDPPRRFRLLRHEEKGPEVEMEAEALAGPEAEAQPEPESTPAFSAMGPEAEIIADEVEPERPRRFRLFRHEASEHEPELESTAEIPALEAEPEVEAEVEVEAETESPPEVRTEESEPESPRRFRLLRHEEKGPEVEMGAEVEVEAEGEVEAEALAGPEAEAQPEPESTPAFSAMGPEAEIIANEVDPEPPRRFRLFRHEASEHEPELESTAEIPALEAEAETSAGIGSESEANAQFGVVGEEREPEPPRRFRLFRHEEKRPEAEVESEGLAGPEAEAESPLDLGAEEFFGVGAPGETAIEIELPPEIPVDEIERTLEDLGRREPGSSRRRWPLRTRSGEGDAPQTVESGVEDGASEMRLMAEQERRRREREYLRNLRVPR